VTDATTTYECAMCKRSFASMAGLTKHLATVHGQREKQTKVAETQD
jgi:DNA-directed RNA polymerase subunit RPC12/RpoP